MNETSNEANRGDSRTMSRRDLLARGAALAALPAVGVLARNGAIPTALRQAAAENSRGRPRRGGTLRGGISGGTSADTLDGQAPVTNADFARINSLFEPLAGMDDAGRLKLVLAEEIIPNAGATSWTIRLKKGIIFHDGRELTADDVIYSFRREVNPKAPKPGGPGLAPINATALKKLDSHTLRVPCHVPFSTFEETIAQVGYGNIVPTNFNPRYPVGTGPFKFKSFAPGQQSLFVRNQNYWRSGLPYLSELVLIDVTDETTQVNGLLSGQFDVVNLLSTASTRTVVSGGGRLLIAKGGGWTPFTMRVDSRPFNDVRVRQAMRYIVDRHQMLDVVFSGQGTIGNDLFSVWDPSYNHSLPQRHQDIDRAKHLLKKAGHEDLRVQLVTSNVAEGTVSAAQVFAQQARAAGVTVNLREISATDFYGPNYLKWTFAQDYWYYTYYLPQVSDATLPHSPFNECHFDDRKYTSLYAEALRTVNPSRRTDIVHEMQRIDYDSGGYIIPYFPPVIDGHSRSVEGLKPSRVGVSLGNYDFASVWKA